MRKFGRKNAKLSDFFMSLNHPPIIMLTKFLIIKIQQRS